MNLRKGFFRLTLVLFILVGIISSFWVLEPTIFILLSFLLGLLLGYKENWRQKAMELLDSIAIIVLKGGDMRFYKKILWGILTSPLTAFIILCLPAMFGVETMSVLRPIITSRKKGKNRRS